MKSPALVLLALSLAGCARELSTATTWVVDPTTCEAERVELEVASMCQGRGECSFTDHINDYVDPLGRCASLPNGSVPAGEDSDWRLASESDLERCAACAGAEGDTGDL